MNDLLDVIKKRLKEGGLEDVFDSLPDGRTYPEAVALTFGIPEIVKSDYAGNIEESLRVTIIVKRLTDPKAKEDACAAERILRTSDLASENGSYELVSVQTESPRPLPWNESNRYVWALDAQVITGRKDF